MLEKSSFNKTKIVATVGPASNSKDMLRALIREGVDVKQEWVNVCISLQRGIIKYYNVNIKASPLDGGFSLIVVF